MKRTASRGRAFVGRLVRNDGGIAGIEFPILAMLAVIIVIGTVELAIDMIVDSTVQIAAQQASRAGLTTTAPASGTRQAQALRIVDDILGRWKAIGATYTVTEANYGTFNNLNTANYSPSNSMGGYGDVVVYTIQLTMPGITGIPKLLGIPAMTLQRNYIVQNEK